MHVRGSHNCYHGFKAAIYVHLGDLETVKASLEKFRDVHPEIVTLEDYKKVPPTICMDYLIEGLVQIWAN